MSASSRRLAAWIADRYADPYADPYETERCLDWIAELIESFGAVNALSIVRIESRIEPE
jgi:hypothetical protein